MGSFTKAARAIDDAARFAEGFAAQGKHSFTSAVILAAGMGRRMQQDMPKEAPTKQFLMLEGEPVILHTIRMFDTCSVIDEIILVVREEEKALYPPLLTRGAVKKAVKIVAGGETRQDSAFAGLQAVHEDCAFVAIHDGARPLITPAQITMVAEEAYRVGAAAAASHVKDTIKEADGAGFVRHTPDRSALWMAATPQIFKVEEYRAAVYMGKKKNLAVTDDCALVEDVGFPVKLVDCGWQNLKITTKEDLYFAQAVLLLRAAETSNADV